MYLIILSKEIQKSIKQIQTHLDSITIILYIFLPIWLMCSHKFLHKNEQWFQIFIHRHVFWIGRKHRQRTYKYPIYQKLLQIIVTTHAVSFFSMLSTMTFDLVSIVETKFFCIQKL